MTLLLVDDHEGIRLTLSAVLEDEGFEVVAVGSCAEGRRSLEDGAISFAAVLLDVRLGDGLGTDLVPVARARQPGAKVILLSGADEIGSHGCGADAELSKGGDIDALIARIRSVMSG